MTDDPAARTYNSRKLRTSLRFDTYSDAKLAGLFLENDFPIVLVKKVFDVILDPAFKIDEVTFEDVWDMLRYISSRRRKDASRREAAPILPESTESVQITAQPSVIPPVIVDLVVGRLMEDRMPLAVAAMDPWWENAVKTNAEPFNNMSLVHRSWTPVAQRGLRDRVVVPYRHINKFLLSPFCGPWIKEMIIYWSVDNGNIGVTKGDIWLLEALLERTPNVRSLVFVSSIIWPGEYLQPPFDVALCLEIISDLLPNLENLWLKHIQPNIIENYELLEACDEMEALCKQIPKMHSLKFLSVRAWRTSRPEGYTATIESDLNWDEQPPPQLKTLELDLSHPSQQELAWLLKPRQDFCLQSLTVTVRNSSESIEALDHPALGKSLQVTIPEIKELRLCLIGRPPTLGWRPGEGRQFEPFYNNLLLSSSKLVSLDIFLIDETGFNLGSFFLPPCLEQLAIHFHDDALRQCLSLDPTSQTSAPTFIQDIGKHLSALPRLRSILITASRRLSDGAIRNWDQDGLTHHMNEDAESYQDSIPEELSNLCAEKNIKLTIIKNAFPRLWDIPRGESSYKWA